MEKGLALYFKFFLMSTTLLPFSQCKDDPNQQTSFVTLESNSSSTCKYFCYSTINETQNYVPPKFTNPCTPPEIVSVYMAKDGETSVQVNWTEPLATDQNGDMPRIDQVTGETNGSYFNGTVEGHRYDIVYLATDENGLKDSCHFSFKVYVGGRCSAPVAAENGRYVCSDGLIPGSKCTYMCNEGYRMIGDADIICQSNRHSLPVWSPAPTCEVVSCMVPFAPDYGNIVCNNSVYSYQTMCSVTCDVGFTAEGPLYMICQADGLWSRPTFCTFPEPLAVRCISPQVFYTDSQQTSVAVFWDRPTSAAIESNRVDLYQIEGPERGDTLVSGLHKVVNRIAMKETNEFADCTVDLHVKVITCAHPAVALNDSLMLYDCSSPTVILGTECQLECRKNLQLAGSSSITCVDNGQKVGKWNWGSGEQPICNEIACPMNVENPVHGKITYKNNGSVSEMIVVCDEGFDFQYQFSGQIMCINNVWVYDQIPDCVAVQRPEYTIDATLYFYGQGCADNSSHLYEEYQSEFQLQFENKIASVCPTNETCKIYNTSIECSYNTDVTSTTEMSTVYAGSTNSIQDPSHSHLKSSITHKLTIRLKFSIQTGVNNSNYSFVFYNDTISQVWEDCRSWVTSTLVAGIQGLHDFHVNYWDISNYTTPTCQEEYLLAGFQCKTCSTGYYLNTTLDRCQRCTYGSYKDKIGISKCDICPEGSSTADIGSRFISECKEYCEQGSVSIDGLKSCAVCPIGYYQDEYGQKQCKICPPETTTILANSTSYENCTATEVHGRCMTSSCNGHRCLNKGGNVSCVCSYGWSGESCEQPPITCSDTICMNSATCITGNSSYTCKCRQGFEGALCEVSVVNGGWAEWSAWSYCSVKCGHGYRQRNRLCNNPSPTKYGKNCFGQMSESRICVLDECQACPELNETKTSYHQCTGNNESGIKSCLVRCKDGFIFGPWFDLFSELTCGMQTGLTWLPANITAPCSEPVKPQSLVLESNIEYIQLIPVKNYDTVKNFVLDQLLHTDCFKSTSSATCILDISLTEEVKSTNTDDDLKITKLESALRRNVTQSEEVVETGIPVEVGVMESTATYIEKFPSEIFNFHVEDTGKWFTANTDTLNIHGTVICETGLVAVEGTCIKCPPGTYARNGYCYFCIKGTYQPVGGQTTCNLCPPELTTESIGSYDIAQCHYRVDTIVVITDSEESTSNVVGTYVGIVTGILSLFVSVVAAWKCRRCRKQKSKNIPQSKEENGYDYFEFGTFSVNAYFS